MNVEIETKAAKAAQFPEKGYINWIMQRGSPLAGGRELGKE